jgi:phage gp36-like protein
MGYIGIEDLKKGIRGEVLQVITREEENALQAIAEAQAEVASYLSARYNIAAEFEKGDADERDIMVVKLVRDIALYNCFNIANPASIPENRVKSYDNAIKFLRDCQSEKASLASLQRLKVNEDGTTSSSYVAFGGNPKRNNHI